MKTCRPSRSPITIDGLSGNCARKAFARGRKPSKSHDDEFRAGEDRQAGNDALHLAIEDELDAARVLQHAGEGVALILSVVLVDNGCGKSDQRQNCAGDQYGEPQTKRQTAAH